MILYAGFGDGGLRYELELQAKQLGVRDNIEFFGARWDVPAFLSISDVVVLASIQDMHPFTLMEAQVAGKACIASDAGGIPEVVRDGETGLIFETGNSVQLAERLVELMDNPELCARLALNAMESGKARYSSEILYNKTMSIYQQVLYEKKSSTQYSFAEPNPTDQYAVIKTRRRRKDISNIFKFELDDSKLDTKTWRTVLRRSPIHYSIPDIAFIQVLSEQNEAPGFKSDEVPRSRSHEAPRSRSHHRIRFRSSTSGRGTALGTGPAT